SISGGSPSIFHRAASFELRPVDRVSSRKLAGALHLVCMKHRRGRSLGNCSWRQGRSRVAPQAAQNAPRRADARRSWEVPSSNLPLQGRGRHVRVRKSPPQIRPSRPANSNSPPQTVEPTPKLHCSEPSVLHWLLPPPALWPE